MTRGLANHSKAAIDGTVSAVNTNSASASLASPINAPLIDKPLYERANVSEEKNSELLQLADKFGVGLIAYVGSYIGIRISPVHTVTASIDLFDEFCIESVINEFEKAKVKKPIS